MEDLTRGQDIHNVHNVNDGLNIGGIRIFPASVLAPMEGITDLGFRRQVRRCGGCGLTVTEFVNCEGLARDVKKVWAKACTQEDGPSSVQIYGRSPERLAQAAAMCEARGAQIVDINLGCPAKKVVSGNAGSALMKEPALCAEIFRAVRSAIAIPMTVKMRLGWGMSSLNAPEIAHIAESEGASMVAVHGRTREEAYRGHSHWELIRPVRDAIRIPLLVNGDILTRADAREALKLSGADGIMAGRGLLRNPWLFQQIADDQAGRPIFEPTLAQRMAFVNEYVETLKESGISESGAAGKLKCFLGYFTRGLANSSRMREQAYRYSSIDEIRDAIAAYFDSLDENRLGEVFEDVVYEETPENINAGDARRCER